MWWLKPKYVILFFLCIIINMGVIRSRRNYFPVRGTQPEEKKILKQDLRYNEISNSEINSNTRKVAFKSNRRGLILHNYDNHTMDTSVATVRNYYPTPLMPTSRKWNHKVPQIIDHTLTTAISAILKKSDLDDCQDNDCNASSPSNQLSQSSVSQLSSSNSHLHQLPTRSAILTQADCQQNECNKKPAILPNKYINENHNLVNAFGHFNTVTDNDKESFHYSHYHSPEDVMLNPVLPAGTPMKFYFSPRTSRQYNISQVLVEGDVRNKTKDESFMEETRLMKSKLKDGLVEEKRQGRIFSIFSLVRFQNVECTPEGTKITYTGTCYLATECAERVKTQCLFRNVFIIRPLILEQLID